MIKEDIKNTILKKKYISFDLFDTLVFRNTPSPSDVFTLVENKYNLENEDKIYSFKKKRMNAEKKCKRYNKSGEINIDEIYRKLSINYTSGHTKRLEEIEKEIEISICFQNEAMKEIYDFCIKNEKKIIITSDMYLDNVTISSIIEKCGYKNYVKLYLSSDYNKKKRTGDLFKFVLDDLNIKPSDLLHIGDNETSDYRIPRQLGIDSILVKEERKHFELYQKKIHNCILLDGFYTHREYNNIYEQLGEQVLGPLLYGFCKWLKQEENKYSPNKIVFLSRDGNIMKQAYEALYGENEINIYAYGSRRGLIVPTIWKDCSIDNIQKSIHFHDRISYEDIFLRIGLNAEHYEDVFKKIGVKKEDKIDGTNLKDNKNFVDIFNCIKNDIIENSKTEYKYSKKYWNSILNNSNRVFIVDIGWNGNMQNALLKFINELNHKDNVELYGYYFGVNPNTRYNFFMKGFMYDKSHDCDLHDVFLNFSGLFESFFMTNHGSLKKYTKEEPGFELYDNEYKSNEGRIISEIDAIETIQKSAIGFVKDFCKVKTGTVPPLTHDDCVYNAINIGLYPSLELVQTIGDFRFYNPNLSYLARSKNNKVCFNELIETNWRIGYLKRYLKLNINYYFLSKIIKKGKLLYKLFKK